MVNHTSAERCGFAGGGLLCGRVSHQRFLCRLLAALVLGLVNTFIRPVLLVLTLPVTFFTLGLFILVINALAFLIASWLVPGFTVYTFWGAMAGALITSIVSWLLNGILSLRD